MSFFRSFTTCAFLTLTGCAVLPGVLGDDCLNCATPEAGDGAIPPGDGGLGGDINAAPIGARSLLCSGSCNPNNTKDTPDNSQACVAADAGADAGIELSCRVVQGPNETGAACAKAGTHADGTSCSSGADCAPGYECVGTPGTCHHYCCDETVCAALGKAANDPARYFCDVQAETASPTIKVPVCMFVQGPCELLQDKCGVGMTCTLVDPNNGVTSCVAIGTAALGDSCEVDHCGANMACVGPLGQRTCQQLCDTNHPCSYPQQCDRQWFSLQQLGVGICQ